MNNKDSQENSISNFSKATLKQSIFELSTFLFVTFLLTSLLHFSSNIFSFFRITFETFIGFFEDNFWGCFFIFVSSAITTGWASLVLSKVKLIAKNGIQSNIKKYKITYFFITFISLLFFTLSLVGIFYLSPKELNSFHWWALI